mgnify:CR=1 FL=1
MSEKKFPILGTNESIDWNLIAPHEKQAMENHCGQTLEQLARRHGLSWYELLCVLLDKPFTEVEYDKEKNYKELCQMALVSEEVKQYRAIGTPEELKAAMKYVYLAKKHGTVGQVIENCVKYEEIGTPEECRAAMEKQTAIPREIIEGKYFCQKCHNLMPYPGYCRCGQKVY